LLRSDLLRINTGMDSPSRPVSAAAISIRPAESGDRATIAELLSANKLVALDETAQFGPQYAVAVNEDGILVGVAGCERMAPTFSCVLSRCRSPGVRPESERAWRRTGLPMPRARVAARPTC